MRKFYYLAFLFTIIFYISSLSLKAEGGKHNKNNRRNSVQFERMYVKFNINNISTFIYNNGKADINSGNSGFKYPKESGHTAVYQSGFVYGGKVDGEIRVGGSTYQSGLYPGKISGGKAEDPSVESVRAYRVRPDYESANFSFEEKDERQSAENIRIQYEKDWNEWPAEYGAPFEDIDNDGNYDPKVDIPGIPGADQTIWFVVNDLDSNRTKNLYGSLPLGFEIQVAVWGYNGPPKLENILYKKYLIINKGNNEITDMYVSYWSDSEIGGAGDDYVGCDTTLNLGFGYNSDDNDGQYGVYPPAYGVKLMQGPLVAGNFTDTAIYKGRKFVGKKNLDMSALGYVFKSGHGGDPTFGDYVEGTLIMYSYMQGKIDRDNYFPVPEEFGGGITRFPFSGDPVTGEGFNDGSIYASADRRMMISSGNFNMAPGDTQEVIFAQLAAGGVKTDNLEAVSLLKEYCSYPELLYKNNFNVFHHNRPTISSSAMNKKVILNWGYDTDAIKNMELYSDPFYEFKGYKVYQLETLNGIVKNKELISTFQKNVIQRYLVVNRDFIKDKLLNNGTQYSYGVSAYYIKKTNNENTETFEGDMSTVSAIPHSPNPGVEYLAEENETINVEHTKGSGTGEVEITVIAPAELTENKYEVTFNQSSSGILQWNLTDVDSSISLVKDYELLGERNYLVLDGFKIALKNEDGKTITTDDKFEFITTGVTLDKELAKEEVKKINVFPNPYYGIQVNEKYRNISYVTFNHLPQKATIRIFNLAGQLVRKLEKNSSSQFYYWDLLNEHRFQVGSGIYIVYIEMPELGETKILKLAVLQKQVIPDRF